MEISVQSLSKSFGATAAVNDVSVAFASGELVALLGPSGSGKTTLLRMIAGLDRPDAGRIFFGREDTSRWPVQKRRVGFVFQHYALFKHMTVEENIAFGLTVRARSTRPDKASISARVRELLDLIQLSGFERRYPAQLSGGQRQRIALARALAIEPHVLLLDEPFGALDAKVRKELRAWLRDIHDRTGLTTLFVTHDQEEALELSDRIIVLNQGRIEQTGSPDEILDHPATAFVHDFIGESSTLIGRIKGGQLYIGDHPLGPAPSSLADDKVKIFVRPQNVSLSQTSEKALGGTVAAIRRHGIFHRITVALPDGVQSLEFDLHNAPTPGLGTEIALKPQKWMIFAGSQSHIGRLQS